MNNADEILDDPLKKRNEKGSFIKVKYILILFIISWIIFQIGTLFRIMSWEGGSQLILIGVLLKVLTGLIGIIKLLTIKEVRSFLNR